MGGMREGFTKFLIQKHGLNKKAGAKVKGSPEASLPKPEGASLFKAAQGKPLASGEAKVRQVALKNTPDSTTPQNKTRSRKKVFNSPVSSAGVGKRSNSASGGKVAALLKTKDAPKKEDKLG